MPAKGARTVGPRPLPGGGSPQSRVLESGALRGSQTPSKAKYDHENHREQVTAG